MAAADYRLMTEATGQRIALALENLAGFGAYLTTSDVVNNLTISDATKVASQAEIYNIANPLSWSNGTQPTLTNGTHYSAGCYYWKRGGLVYLHISAQFDSPPTNVLLFTLPSGYRPIGSAEISVSGGGSYNAKAQCVIRADGTVYVSSVDKWVTGSGLFIYAT